MKKIAMIIVMVIVIFIGSVLVTNFAGPKEGHVKIWSSAGSYMEYDYVEIDGETIEYNKTLTWWT